MTAYGSPSQYGSLAIKGVAWRYTSYFGGKFMVFISTIVLARLLSKDDFGVVGYALTAIAFLDVASELGVAEAVVYYKDDEKNFSTAFWIGLLIGITLLVLSWIIAPLLVAWFKDDRVLIVFRLMALSFPLSALGSVHEAVLRKKLEFGKTTIPLFLRALSKGMISIALALLGYGFWSLIWGQLGGILISSITFWLISSWRPSIEFDFSRARALVSYGVKDIGANFLSMVLLNLDYWLVGRYLGAEVLGIYTLAYRMPELLILQFARIISQVVFPIYTKLRDRRGGLSRSFEKTTTYISLVTIPLGLGLVLVAKPFILVFLTEKWLDAVPVLQMIAIYSVFLSLIHSANSAYKAVGNFTAITWLGLFRLFLLLPAMWWATIIKGSIIAVGQVHAMVAFAGSLLGLFVAARLLGLSLRNLYFSLQPALVAGLCMAGAVALTLNWAADYSPVYQLLIAIPIGALVMILVLWLLSRDLLQMVKKDIFHALAKNTKSIEENS